MLILFVNGFRTILVGTDTLENLKVLKTQKAFHSYREVVDYLIRGEREWSQRNKPQIGMKR